MPPQCVYNWDNKTRQGYARKRILKPAGYFFPGLYSDCAKYGMGSSCRY